jgi:uroporphyrinogen decarboxylase
MNGFERFYLALDIKKADRVPITEFGVHPDVYLNITPQAGDDAEFQALMDMDAICCPIEFSKISEHSDGTFVDEWQVTYKLNPELKHHPVDYPIKTYDDLKTYQPPDPNLPQRLGNLKRVVNQYKGEKAIIFAQRASFMWSAYIRGMDNLLVDFLSAPDFAHELLDKVLDVHIKSVINAIKAGADTILLVDDYASNQGLLFSPVIFKDFILPRLKKIIQVIHENGAKVIKHSDGNVLQIIDMLIEAGIDGLHPIDPIAGMDISKIKQKYGDRICVVGNIDCGPLLTFGTPQQVRKAVKNCIKKASYNGGHIITSSNSIHSSVKPANYIAMLKAAKKYGQYKAITEKQGKL